MTEQPMDMESVGVLQEDQSKPAGSDVPIETLGKEIVARIEKGDKAKARADDFYISAGKQLIKAQERVGKGNFRAFLNQHCNGLSRGRAYELIAIAKGDTTGDEVREKANERKKRHRTKAAAGKPNTKATASKTTVSVPERTPKVSQSEKALVEFKAAVNIWTAMMDAETKQKALAYVTEKLGGALAQSP